MAAVGASSTLVRAYLKKDRDRPVRGGNPWIFSQAVGRCEPSDPEPGELGEIFDAGGDLLGVGYINRSTTIAIRMLAWGESPPIEQLIERRIRNALGLRKSFISDDTNCYRLLNGDGDGLSGVVVDVYADVLVIQLLTAGAERLRDSLVGALQRIVEPRAILERSHGAVRRQEGLADRSAAVHGTEVGEVVVRENGIKLAVDFEHSQKTGAFLDQRDNHALAGRLASGARVLDAYCYGCGFALAGLAGGAARVTAIDTSAKALEFARRNLALNDFDSARVQLLHEDAAKFLAETSERFDLIALDPPPLARNRDDAERAGRLYTELNSLAVRALAPGGRMLTFSCSVHFRGEDFVRAVRFGAARARRTLRTLAHLGPGPDHPVLLGHVEGDYLTGLLLQDLG